MSLFSTKSLGHIFSSYKHITARAEVATLGLSFQVLLSLLNSKGVAWVAWVREFVGGVGQILAWMAWMAWVKKMTWVAWVEILA